MQQVYSVYPRIYEIWFKAILRIEYIKFKGWEKIYIDENIREIQELYKEEDGQKEERKEIQNEEVFLYKPYKEPPWLKTPEPIFIQDKINNLEKYMKFIHSSVKTMLFSPLPYYKSIQLTEEQD